MTNYHLRLLSLWMLSGALSGCMNRWEMLPIEYADGTAQYISLYDCKGIPGGVSGFPVPYTLDCTIQGKTNTHIESSRFVAIYYDQKGVKLDMRRFPGMSINGTETVNENIIPLLSKNAVPTKVVVTWSQ